MKRLLSILFIFVAIAVMVSVSAMPHHHHDGGGVCVGHEHSQGHGSDDDCVAYAEYTDRCDREECCGAMVCGHVWHKHFAPPCTSVLPEISPCSSEPDGSCFGGPLILYCSIDVHTGCGLRAPPVHLC